MLAKANVTLPGLPVDSIVEVDPHDPTIEGLLAGGYLQPIEHKAMPVGSRPPVTLNEQGLPEVTPPVEPAKKK